MPKVRYAGLVLLLLLAGAAVRVFLVEYVHPIETTIYSDMANYVRASEDIIAGDWEAWHFFQPIGYPLLLARLRSLTPDWMNVLSWLQIAASTATMAVVWRAATTSLGRRAGLLALAIAAIHLPWITFTGFAFSETFFTLLLALLALLTWRLAKSLSAVDAIAWGAVFFTAFLLKGTHIFVVALLLPMLLLYKGWRSLKPIVVISVVVWSGFIAHGFFTYQTIGTFQMTATAGGLNFVEGKCPLKANVDNEGATWLSPLYYQLGKTETAKWDRSFTESGYYFGKGLDCIRDNPLVLIQSFESIPFLFIGNWLWPSNNLSYRDWIKVYEMLFAIFALGGLSGFAILGLRKGREDVVLTWVVPIIALFACVYVFKSEIRFRVPFDVWIIPLAAAGWMALVDARRTARAADRPQPVGPAEPA